MTYALHVYEAGDENGTVVGSIDLTQVVIDSHFTDVLHGAGSMLLRLPRHHADAALLQQNRYCRLETDAGIWEIGWFLEEGVIDLSSADEQGGEFLKWEGRGSLAYLDNGVMDNDSNLLGGKDPIDGFWDLSAQGNFAGASNGHPIPMMKRALVEVALNPPNGISLVDHSGFTYALDSDAAAVPFLDGVFGVDVGDSLYDLAARLDQIGGFIQRMSHDFVYDMYLAYGDDKAGAFGAGTVRFEKGINIAVALQRKISPNVRRTHLVVGGSERSYIIVENPTYTPGDVVRWGFLPIPETNDPTQLEATALNNFAARERASDAYVLPMPAHGSDPTNGIYEPGIHFKVGDTVRAHTGTGTHDLNEADVVVAAITIHSRDGTDYVYDVELGYNYHWTEGPGDAFGTGSQNRFLLCDPPQIVETSDSWKSTSTGTPPAGWHDAGFDDSGYAYAVNVSEPSWYDTGSSRWIWEDAGDQGSGEERAFRHEFHVSQIPKQATLVTAADNGCEVYINGTLVATIGGAERGAADLPPHVYTAPVTFTISPAEFVVGINCISIIGWNETLGTPGPAGVYAVLTLDSLSGADARAARCNHRHLVEDLPTAETDTALVLRPDGGGGVEWGAEATGGRPPYDYVVAPSDSTADMQAIADAVCDGTADEVQWQASIAAAVAANRPYSILILPGTYITSDAVDFTPLTSMGLKWVVFEASGTTLRAGANMTTMVKLDPAAGGQIVTCADIRLGLLDGNASGGMSVTQIINMARFNDNILRVQDIYNGSGIGVKVSQAGVADFPNANNKIDIEIIHNFVGDAFSVTGTVGSSFGFQGNTHHIGEIIECGAGIVLGTAVNQTATYNTFICGVIEHCDGAGIYDYAGANTFIVGNLNSNGVELGGPTGMALRSTYRVHIDLAASGGIDAAVLDQHYVQVNGAQYGRQFMVERASTPATPASGFGDIYFKSDGYLYSLNDAGVERQLGTAGVTDHGALTGLTDDDHTQYLKETDVAAKGDLYAASANDTVGVLTVGSNNQVLTADSTQALGVKWADAPGPAGAVGEILVADTHSTPLIFGDLLQNEAEDNLLYADV